MSDQFAYRKTLNVFLLGLVFMLAATRVHISILKIVLNSASDKDGQGYVEGFTGDGYMANAVLYGTLALSNFLAPWIIKTIGPR